MKLRVLGETKISVLREQKMRVIEERKMRVLREKRLSLGLRKLRILWKWEFLERKWYRGKIKMFLERKIISWKEKIGSSLKKRVFGAKLRIHSEKYENSWREK